MGVLEELSKRLKSAGGVYSFEPCIVDFSAWPEEEFELLDELFPAVVNQLRKNQVNVVEVRAFYTGLEDLCEALGLRFASPTSVELPQNAETPSPVTTATKSEQQTPTESNSAVPNPPNPPAARSSMVVDAPVRSGQRVYAQGCDLVVMGQVSAGAEVIADGHVHIYGVLRGRALAGASGDTSARIHSTCFEPELVSVAGYYLTFDGGFPADVKGQPTLVHLAESENSTELRLKPINVR